MKKIKFRFILFFSIFVFFITIIVSRTSIYKNLELKWIDINFSLRGKEEPSDDIVIVEISDQSFKELGRYPFPRSYYAKLIENLSEAGAKLIIFDIEFCEPTLPEEDEHLAESAALYGNVIFAGKLIEQKIGGSVYKSILKPIPDITKLNLDWGLVGISQDPDHFARQYSLFATFQDVEYYSLGIKALQSLIREKTKTEPRILNKGARFGVGHYIFPKYSANTSFINYYGPAYTFSVYSMDTVLDDEKFTTFSEQEFDFEFNTFGEYLNQKTFQDKIVLVGATAEELHDLFPTPFYSYGKERKLMPGVEIHANFLEMVLHNNSISTFSFLYFLIGLLVIIFLINFIFQFIKKPFINIISSFILIVVYLYFVYYFFSAKNILINITEFPTAILISFLGNLVHQYYIGSKEKRFIKNAFQHYLSPTVIKQLTENPDMLKLGGEKKVLTAFFSDVASFSTISEKLTPEELVNLLNEYLTDMTDIILEYEGTVDKFEGDAIIAFFGAPVSYEDHARRACLVSIDMQKRLAELRKKWSHEKHWPEHVHNMKMRIGLNTGPMVVGNMGSKTRMDYTMMGDSVNLASRLEGANKQYGTYNMISEFTYEAAKDFIEARELDMIRVVGKSEPVKVYQLLCRKGELTEDSDKLYKLFTKAIELYRDQQWDKAILKFEDVIKLNDDEPSKRYIERCKQFKLNPPPKDWDGVFTLTTK